MTKAIESFVTYKNVADSLRASGNGANRDPELISQLSDGARALLVAIITQPIADTTTLIKGGNAMVDTPSMTGRQILQAMITYKALNKEKIGFEVNLETVRHWVYELHNNTLLYGGESCGFLRGRRKDADDFDKIKYRLAIAPRSVLRFPRLEVTHKRAIEEFLEEQRIANEKTNAIRL
jgi:hypothetical protein